MQAFPMYRVNIASSLRRLGDDDERSKVPGKHAIGPWVTGVFPNHRRTRLTVRALESENDALLLLWEDIC